MTLIVDDPRPVSERHRVGTNFSLGIVHRERKGRCVIAQEPIPQGAIIECAPALVIGIPEREHVDRISLTNYYFNLGRKGISEHAGDFPGCLALGITTLCNHSEMPNASCTLTALGDGHAFLLTALDAIEPGTEICIRYTETWFDVEPPVDPAGN